MLTMPSPTLHTFTLGDYRLPRYAWTGGDTPTEESRRHPFFAPIAHALYDEQIADWYTAWTDAPTDDTRAIFRNRAELDAHATIRAWEHSAGLDRLHDALYVFEDRPLWFHLAGLSQTASGYGRRLVSRRVVRFPDGRTRRVYVTQYSNAGTAWIVLNGRKLIVD